MGQEQSNPKIKDDKGAEEQGFGNYAKYMGVAFQMLAIIGGAAFIGFKIDQWYNHKVQWVTAIACVIGVCFSIYHTIKQLKG